MAVSAKERAEKACKRAEELFLAGHIHDAHRQAKKAKQLCPSLARVDNAVAVYEIHVHADTARGGGGWRAIFGIRPGAAAAAATHDAVKKEFRRLVLLVHSDKAKCAAADSAVRLLTQARAEALATPPPPPPQPPQWKVDDDDDDVPPPAAGATQQPQARQARKPLRMTQPPVMGPREPTLIYCPSCDTEFRGMVGSWERRCGMKCARCPAWLNAPWPTKPPAEKKPPPAPGRQVFQCPANCPGCGERYTSMVCVGRWCLQCKACSKAAMVDVHGPGDATASVTVTTRRA